MSSLRSHYYVILLCLIVMCTVWAAPAWSRTSRLSGVAEWEYADYSAASEQEDITSSHFIQKYSLMYSTAGLLAGGRLGDYSVKVGSEWAALDTKINGGSLDESRFKFLYSGAVNIAPGALPFRFTASSGDTTPVSFTEDLRLGNYTPMINPGIVTDVINGQSITNRATLVVGIRNGSYLGNYRELLSKFPRLLFDYSDNYTRDLKRATPVDYRARDLAFISLNKKDNWFHYRVKDFSDEIDPGNNWKSTQMLLGTIDHLYRRQWVNLTNWIKISVDGSTTETSGPGVADEEEIRLNLFTQMKRDELSVENYSSYSRRIFTDGKLIKRLNIPTFATFKLNRARALQTALLVDEDETIRNMETSNRTQSYYAKARLNALQAGRRTLIPYLEMQVYDELIDEDSGQGARVGFEWHANDLGWSQDALKVDYSLAVVRKTDPALKDGEYIENRLNLLLPVDFSRNFLARLGQDLIFGYGNARVGGIGNLSVYGDDSLPAKSSSTSEDVVDYVFHSKTYASLLYNKNRVRNSLQLMLDYSRYGLDESYASDESLSLRIVHKLSYTNNALTVAMTNRFYFNDGLQTDTEETAATGPSGDSLNPQSRRSLFVHNAKAIYNPNRTWYHKAEANFVLDDNGTNQYSLSQRSKYTLFTRGGMVRKYAVLQQGVSYEQYTLAGSTFSETVFSLSATYMPYRHLILEADCGYTLYEDSNELSGGLGASLNFKKLQTYIRYRQAQLDNDSKRTEKRWEIGLKKIL